MRMLLSSNEITHIINRIKGEKIGFVILMTGITDKQEELLEAGENISVDFDYEIRGEKRIKKFEISNKSCYCYGTVDFDNPEDVDVINKYDWIGDSYNGAFVPRRFNYKDNTTELVNNKVATVETFSNILLTKVAHAAIGKPEKLAIFKIPNFKFTGLW